MFDNPQKNRRIAPKKSKEELFKLSRDKIQQFIREERRHDELERLQEVHKQNRVWRNTVLVCGGLIFVFLVLAVVGAFI